MQTLTTPLSWPSVTASRAGLAPYAHVLLFVGGWAALGQALALDANAYLVLGVPLTVAFQLGVRRRPLREMWLREGAAFQLGRRGVRIAIGLALTPALSLLGLLYQGASWPIVCWMIAAVAGAIAGGYAFSRFTRASARELFLCLASVGLPASLVLVGMALARTHSLHVPLPSLVGGLSSFVLYVPACFCIEEVAFRGVLDAHVHRPGAPRGFLSAVFVSVLWGLWHWPIVPHAGSWWVLPLQLIAVHTVLGVPLSHFWRRSANLAVPVVTHAFIDGVRNALLAQLM